ncbi:MAG TPA: ubiquitin-like domain-containing protein [Anaerolineae bacterium]|nr:ubiquitin-like domain-containing protein [Anaerolineae bacterium]
MIEGRRVPFWRGVRNLLLLLARVLPSPGLWASIGVLYLAGHAAVHYADGLAPLTLVVDGTTQRVRTRCLTVEEVLGDLQVQVSEWDWLEPTPDTAIQPGMRIVVQHAHPVTVVADGTTRTVHTQAWSAERILEEVSIALKPGDELWVNGQLSPDPAGASGSLGSVLLSRKSARLTVIEGQSAVSPIAHLQVRRAARIQVYDGGVMQTVRTTASTLGQAMSTSGILLYLGDRVSPDLNAPVQTGMRVHIERGVPVDVFVDGRVLRTRSHAQTVGEVLAELGVSLIGHDFPVPAAEAPVHPGLEVRVVRVVETQYIEQEEIPFETEWVSEPSLEIDQRRVDAAGANGILRRRYRVLYHDGAEIARNMEDEWVAREPQTRQIAYGTQVVVRTLETPDGPVEYWRRIPVFLTSYTAATCGKSPSDPTYGITRLGWKMRRGIVAVDPSVISLLSKVYVPGYGRGVAADTGGLIIGRHVDLGYNVGAYEHWFGWSYVYVLTPVPSPSRIRWVLPDFPRGRYP